MDEKLDKSVRNRDVVNQEIQDQGVQDKELINKNFGNEKVLPAARTATCLTFIRSRYMGKKQQPTFTPIPNNH